MKPPKTPELDKLRAVHDTSQSIGEFLENLQTKGITLCTFRAAGNNGKPKYVWRDGVKKRRLNGQPTKGSEPTSSDAFNLDADNNPEYEAWPDQYMPQHKSIETLLAEYFAIDLTECERERKALLAFVRDNQ